jgi:hypothetical protein
MSSLFKSHLVPTKTRAIFGFGIGLAIMISMVQLFTVGDYDYINMQRGIRLLLTGVNPWAPGTRIPDFYNPPFSIIFLWPMLLTTPKMYLVVGGASLFAFVFYHRAWVALAWFATNTMLWMLNAAGIDMFVVGVGLLFLLAGDNDFNSRKGLFWRVLAYGLFMVKPQGTIFIVGLYILSRRDWKGLLVSIIIYGVLFLPLYPDWLSVLFRDPPRYQIETPHSVWGQYGPWVASMIALAVTLSRRWKYFQLGGALAGVMTPYGMPGVPLFLTLTSVKSLKAIPIYITWSGCIALLTWVQPPPGVDYWDFINPRMAIYQMSMLGMALILACYTSIPDESDTSYTLDVWGWLKKQFSK